jgi:rod shape determining protein RodA
MLAISLFDYTVFVRMRWILFLIGCLLLVAVLLIGVNVGGATRWINIGVQFQPSDLMKMALIVFYAGYFQQHDAKLNTPKVLLGSILILCIPLYLIYREPDLSTTIVTALIFCVILFTAGLSWKIILSILAVAVPSAAIFLSIVLSPDQTLIAEYQRDRILLWLRPMEYAEEAYQQQNSIIAIGSGQLYGKGLNNNDASSANKGDFIAEIQTDFIFTVAGEELGFLGSAGIVILLLLISLECLLISMRAKDLSGQIICCGMATLISIQSFINIGVATRILPNTGTPLPFVSYGLTSLLTLFRGMGLVLNAGLQTKIRISPEMRRLQRERGRVRL